MPRPIEYNREDFLKKSTQLFLERGFAATSLREVFAATGMNRTSLYQHFGDKQQFYREVLDYYRKNLFAELYLLLEANPQGLPSIAAFFDAILQPATKVRCVMMSCFVEEPSMEKAALAMASQHFARLKQGFCANLALAQSKGELKEGVDIESAANLLIGFLHGLPTSTRWGGNGKMAAALRQLIKSLGR